MCLKNHLANNQKLVLFFVFLTLDIRMETESIVMLK